MFLCVSARCCLDPWQRRSDLFSCHGFMMEINPDINPEINAFFCQSFIIVDRAIAMAIWQWQSSVNPCFRHLPYILSAFVVQYVKAENRPCLVGCLNKSQCHEPFYSMTILHYDFCDTGPLFSRLVVFLRLYQMY